MNYKRFAAPVFAAFVFLAYFGTATQWSFRPGWAIDYINPMAQALLNGRLDIPNPAMTYDLALYNGRWYMTWGVLAAAAHIPLQLIAGGRFVPAIYTSLPFGTATVLMVWLMLERIRNDWFPKATAWSTAFFAFLYAFGTMQYYLSSVGSVWQVNQVVSTFFGVAGTAVIFRKNRTSRDYLISSLLYGIALLGRPTVGLLSVIPLSLAYRNLTRRNLFAIALPLALAMSILFFYNAVRFGNPFETGHRFLTEAAELAAKREEHGMISLFYIPTNVWHMIAAPPRISWNNGPALDIDLMGNSIFLLSPFLVFAFGTLTRIRSNTLIASSWIGIAVTAGASLVYYNTGWMQFGYRYALDFSFLLVILAYIRFAGRLRWWMPLLSLYTLWVNYAGIRLLQ
jgi:hypothetical protein